MNLVHLTLTSQRHSRLPLFRDEAGYRAAIVRMGRVVARAAARCGVGLALFALVDEHLHQLAFGARAAIGRLTQAMLCSLRRVVATPLAPAHPAPVESRSHLRWLLRYFLEQTLRHQLPLTTHPALFVGSCLPDLVGARRVPGITLRLAHVLTRFCPQQAFEIVRLDASPLLPADDDAVRAAGPARIASSSSAAFAADPAFAGRSPLVVRARRAAAKLGLAVGLSAANMAWATRSSPSTIRRLAAQASDVADLLVVRRRIALEDRVANPHAPDRLDGMKTGEPRTR